MRKTEVPQDQISTYANNKKAIYAVDESGKYNIVPSSGWSVEEEATKQALEELRGLSADALEQVKAGKKSTLFYHMYAKRMDLQILSDSTGFFKWTIKLDFNPIKFAKIKSSRLATYADVLGVQTDELQRLPQTRGDLDE